MTSFVDARMSRYAHDDLPSASIISICFHCQKQALSSTRSDVSHTVLVSVEQVAAHSDHFVLDNSDRVKQNRVQCVGMHIFDKALLHN